MSKKYMYLFGAALLALSVVGASAQSVQAKSVHQVRRTNVTRTYNRYFVNAPLSISSNARTIYGTATPGSVVSVLNGSKTLDRTYASKSGHYVLGLPDSLRAGTSLRVMANKGYQHPFRDVSVKTPANQKAAVTANQEVGHKTARKVANKSTQHTKVVRKATKRHAKKVTKKAPQAAKHGSLADQISQLQKQMKALVARNTKDSKEYNGDKARLNKLESQSKAVKKATVKRNVKRAKGIVRKANKNTAKLAQTPTGNWVANQSKNYSQKWSFTQKLGLNETLYRNGRYAKKLVTNAPYKLDAVKPDFWKITYKPSNAKNSSMMYMHLLTNDNFQVTNAKGKQASLNFVRA